MLYGLTHFNKSAALVVYICQLPQRMIYRRVDLLYVQPKDLLLVFGGVKLSPNISLRPCPCSTNLTSFPTMAALSMMWLISFAVLHKRLANCSLLRFEFNPIPHFRYILFLSSSDNLFLISLLSIPLSLCRALTLSIRLRYQVS